MMTDEQPPYLNLAHQFLDTNFFESPSNNFSLLPLISTNTFMKQLVQPDPPMAVDYFSHALTPNQYRNCWREISNNKFMKPFELSNVDSILKLKVSQPIDDLMMFLPTTSRARLENACWRAWYKEINNLKELDPAKINWFKENDITVLYGPLIEEERNENEGYIKDVSNEQVNDDSIECFSPTSTAIDDDNNNSSNSNRNHLDKEQLIEPHQDLDNFKTHCQSRDSDDLNSDDSNSELFSHERPLSNRTSVSSMSSSLISDSRLKSVLKKRGHRKCLSLDNTSNVRVPSKKLSFNPELESTRLLY